jgi:hypothetical protein
MAIQSTQFAGLSAFPPVKIRGIDAGEKDRTLVASTPAAYAAQAVNETFDLFIIPKGARVLPFGRVECAAGASSSTLSIGLRNRATGVVISATSLATGININAAGVKDANNGAAFAGGGFVAADELVAYATFTGATNTANQPITVYQPIATPSP